ncbi:thiamine biosynthesis protein ThiF [Corynebacterium ulcerans]|uniref:ThiF family adenylyltransferase n=1 Tax=Corynebacterium ulcerans TaxID=65058 RepID=UPI00062865E3|nr:ThiF family adenylyltransferase [Corynebacterium ulcerans]KKO85822.1 thiamine biosynthesis protein ThiF [Corynebacterium ulcerans]KKO87428.1 thiamine biosynthesis protein ThiF [Corynebacterium ulcerans]BDV26232.1 thiamine biosynthesis protein ThiF [Corynebacterium ulcerans]
METSLPRSELHRVSRQMLLPGFGLSQQESLHNAHVLVVGIGGLGCPIVQQLAAAGIGKMTLIDHDTVDITNIHRQILFSADDCGQPKVEVAARRAQALQPGIVIEARNEALTARNACELVAGADIVLDGSDTFASKYLVADAAEIVGTPLVWGTVLGFHGDVALWYSGPRERGVGLRDVFPYQLPADAVPTCATAGVLGVTTSVVGGLMSTTALAWLSGLDRAVGKVLSYDAIPATIRQIQAVADPQRSLTTSLSDYAAAASCEFSEESTAKENSLLLQRVLAGEAALLDIREPHEVLLDPFPPRYSPHMVPLSSIVSEDGARAALLDATQTQSQRTIVVACASGQRSQQFIAQYNDLAVQASITLLNLPGGNNKRKEST